MLSGFLFVVAAKPQKSGSCRQLVQGTAAWQAEQEARSAGTGQQGGDTGPAIVEERGLGIEIIEQLNLNLPFAQERGRCIHLEIL